MTSENTVLYAASVVPLKNQELYRLAYANASSERREKVDLFRFEKDKCLSLGAEMLLQYGLREAKAETTIICGKTNSLGKPILSNTNLHYNISHSGDWAICAVSDIEVGCDIEKIGSADLNVAKRFFCPEEYAQIAEQASPAQQNLLFYRYWTLKESFIKATGLGLTMPLDSFQIQIGKCISLKRSTDQRSFSFAEFGDIPGYCCALCGIGDALNVHLNIIDLYSLSKIWKK